MKKKRNPSKHVFILANKTTSSTLFYLFFVFNEKNRACLLYTSDAADEP